MRRNQPVTHNRKLYCFNRPQAIRCLATPYGPAAHAQVGNVSIARRRFVVLRLLDTGPSQGDRLGVSIARRRFVVLRLSKGTLAGVSQRTCFNRPQAIRCLATLGRRSSTIPPPMGFNRPQAIRCLATRSSKLVVILLIEFQSPAGDSLSCDATTSLICSKGC